MLLSVHLNKDCTNLLVYTSGHRVDPQRHHLVDTDCGYDKMYIFVCVRVIMWLGLKNFLCRQPCKTYAIDLKQEENFIIPERNTCNYHDIPVYSQYMNVLGNMNKT